MQTKVKNFCDKYNISCSPEYRLLDLQSELGELSKEILEATNYGQNKELKTTPDMEAELGDVIFSLLCLANSLSIDAEKSLDSAIEKYTKRFAVKNSIGSEN